MKKILSLALVLSLVVSLLVAVPASAASYKEGIYTYTVSNGEATITKCDQNASGDIAIPSTLGGYGVTSIGEYAFSIRSSITNISIPNSVTSIGDYAFSDCSNLASINIPDSVTSIGDYAFSDCSNLASINIPDSVTTIGNGAFSECSSLTSITILEGVTSIGKGAFRWCSSLTSISIPDSVTSIGEWTFFHCSSLTSIKLSDNVTSIGEYAFNECYNLTSITIPDGVTSIDDLAFWACGSLASISIPDSLTSIGGAAFYACYNLTDVYYGGSEQQWNNIEIESSNTSLTNARIHYNRTSIPTGTEGNTNSTSKGAPIIESAKITYSGSTYDLFKKTVNIEKDSETTVGIEVEVDANGCKDLKVYLGHAIGDTVVEIPQNACKDFSPGKVFEPGREIYLFAVDAKTGKSTAKKTKLNILTASDFEWKFKGDDDKLEFKLGNKVGFVIPENVPGLGGSEISWEFDFIPLTYSFDPEDPTKINIVFGANIATEEKDGRKYLKDFNFKQYVKDIKKAGSIQNKSLKTLRDKYDMSRKSGMGLFKKKSWEKSGNLNVAGYAEGYVKNGKPVFSEGQLIVEAEIKFEYQGQMFIWVVPFYYELAGKVGAGFEGNMININEKNLTPQFNGYLTAKAGGDIGVGVGIAGVATAGASGEATLNIKTALNKIYTKAWVDGNASFNVKLFGKTVGEKEFAKGTYLIFETGNNKGLIKDNAITMLETNSLESSGLMSGIELDRVYENESREYLNNPTVWLDSYRIDMLGASGSGKNMETIASNVYPESSPQICEIDGKKVIVMQWDDERRADADRSMLVYSVYNKGWSEPVAVADDGTADFYPVFRDGYLVWQNQKGKITDDMTLRQIGQQGEICIAKWNGNGFDKAVTVTDNNVLDTQPTVAATNAGASVVWTTNTESDILGTTGTNKIMRADFYGDSILSKNEVKSNLNAITKLTAGTLNGEVAIGYVADGDNDLNTIDDWEISIISGGNERKLTNNAVLDSNPVFENDSVYYYSEGNIYYCNPDGTNLKSVFDEAKPGLTDSFVADINKNGNGAIWWAKKENGITEIYSTLLNDGVWSEESQVTDLGNDSKYPSGIIDDSGVMTVAFNSSMDGRADLMVISVVPDYDLELLDVYADEDENKIYGVVKNTGEKEINSYSVATKGCISINKTSDDRLLPGQTAEIELEYKLPENFAPGTIDVTVSAVGCNEINTADNSVSLKIGSADIEVSNIATDDESICNVTADVSNIGYSDASDVKISLVDGDRILDETTVDLKAKKHTSVSLSVDKKKLNFYGDSKRLYIKAELDAQEVSTGNNEEYVFITSPYDGAPYYTDILEYTVVEEGVVIHSIAGNNTDENISCRVYTAVYDSEGNAKCIGNKKVDIGAKNDTAVDITLDCALEKGDTIKSFFLNNMDPLTKTAIITIE